MEDTILQRIDPSRPEDKENAITVRDVFNLLACGMSTKAIRQQRPEIRSESIALARAFLIAKFPDLYDEKIAGKPAGDYRMLVDENLSARIIPTIRSGFGYATHTNFVKLNGRPDKEVWEWAANNNIDAIVTRDKAMKSEDKDLTMIALKEIRGVLKNAMKQGTEISLDELPLVIHIIANKYDEAAAAFNKYRDSIDHYLQTRSTPYIQVSKNSVTAGPSYAELVEETNPEVHSRTERWVQQWTRAILNNGKGQQNLTPEQIEKIEEMVRAGASICSMSESPRSRFTKRFRLGIPANGAKLP